MYATELHRSFNDTYCTFIALSTINQYMKPDTMPRFKLYFGFDNRDVDDSVHVMT